MFSGRTAAEVFAGNHNITRLYPLGKGGVEVFHAVRSEFLFVDGVQVSCRNDDIGVNIVAVLDDSSFEFHFAKTSFGSVILPVMALAAATAGLAR